MKSETAAAFGDASDGLDVDKMGVAGVKVVRGGVGGELLLSISQIVRLRVGGVAAPVAVGVVGRL